MTDRDDALPSPTWANTYNSGLAEVPASFSRRKAMKLADKAGYPYVAFCGHIYSSDEDTLEEGSLAQSSLLGSPRDTALADVAFLERVEGLLSALCEEDTDEATVEAEVLELRGYVDALLDSLRGTEEPDDE